MLRKKILVTGCNGQLGLSLRKLSEGFPCYEFTFTDRHNLDITNENALRNSFEAEWFYAVLHFAAYTAVDKAESEKELCRTINTEATKTIACLCEEFSAKLIFISTDFVFDGSRSIPYLPTDKTSPLSVYGMTKAQGEEAALTYCSRSLVIRTSWLYSEFGNNFVKTMRKLGNEREVLNVVFDQVGTPCYAEDLARAVLLCLEKDFNRRILHFSNEGVCSWYDFAKKIMALSGVDCMVHPIRSAEYPTAAARPSFSVLDKADIKQFLNIEIPYWEESLTKCIKILDK